MTTASQFAHSQILSIRSKDDGKTTSTYHGKGYTYHLHKTAKDIWAKLQIARDTLKKFVKNVGVCNTIHLPGLNVCDQGVGGWHEIFVIDERKLWAVVHFLKRLNRWMLGANTILLPAKRYHYFLEVRKFEHTTPRHLRHAPYNDQKPVTRPPAIPYTPSSPLSVQAKMVPTARLQQLATTVNTRFGH
jgi:hypothetical protein